MNGTLILGRPATCDINLFSNISNKKRCSIEIADGRKLFCEGSGSVSFALSLPNGDSMDIHLEEVLFVPNLSSNLISVRKLTMKGHSVTFKGDQCYLSQRGQRLEISRFNGSLYRVHALYKRKSIHDMVYSAKQNDAKCIHEWHVSLAHRNLGEILNMQKKGILQIKDCECLDVCEPCIRGKMSRNPFPKESKPVDEILICITSDLCGPLHIETYDHKKYFITFTDVHSKYCDVYFLRSKDQTQQVVKNYIEKLKTVFGRKPRIFRSDRGGEFFSSELQEYLKSEGIQFQCTVGYAP